MRKVKHLGAAYLELRAEQAEKYLTNIYSANDQLSSKSKWGLGAVIASLGYLSKEASKIDWERIEFRNWLLILIIAATFISLICFFLSIRSKSQFHAGIEPRQLEHGIFYGSEEEEQYIALLKIQIKFYQSRIDKNRPININMSSMFNKGLYFLCAAGILYFLFGVTA